MNKLDKYVPKEFNLPFMNFKKNPNPFTKNVSAKKLENKFKDVELGTFDIGKLELTKIKKLNIKAY